MGGNHLVGDLGKDQVAYLRAYISENVPVSMLKFWARECVEKNLMCLSAVPPPEARVPGLLGHHPMALTAALCSWNLTNSLFPFCE